MAVYKFGFITSSPSSLETVPSVFMGNIFLLVLTQIKDFFVGSVVDCTFVVLNLRYFVPV